MINIATVCGNRIGSSLLLKMKVEAIYKEMGIEANVESCDSNAAIGKGTDLFVTVREFRSIFSDDRKVAIIESYTNRKEIEEDLVPVLEEFK